ncbi:hypothetical protein [Actinoplanes sp. NPDC051851]|uniref:hypothetical protein n=1 Tax=Actinoplanes sp. NPDC051851 TaxID=3154753 RepID=UPI00341C2317
MDLATFNTLLIACGAPACVGTVAAVCSALVNRHDDRLAPQVRRAGFELALAEDGLDLDDVEVEEVWAA